MTNKPKETHQPPEPPLPADSEELLIMFLRERDQECPRCGYNLRNLTRPICPECEEPLALAVKAEQLNLVPFIAAIAPGIFSGLLFVLFLIFAMISGGGGRMPFGACMFLVFLGTSGGVSFWLAVNSRHFLRQKPARQSILVAVSWVIHVIAFVVLLVLVTL